jgi:hypothetical protein
MKETKARKPMGRQSMRSLPKQRVFPLPDQDAKASWMSMAFRDEARMEKRLSSSGVAISSVKHAGKAGSIRPRVGRPAIVQFVDKTLEKVFAEAEDLPNRRLRTNQMVSMDRSAPSRQPVVIKRAARLTTIRAGRMDH